MNFRIPLDNSVIKIRACFDDSLYREKTPAELELDDSVNELGDLNDKFKTINSSIDTIDEQEVLSILETRLDLPPEAKGLLFGALERVDLLFKKIEELLTENSQDIDINKQDPCFNVTVLHNAAGIGSMKLATILLKYGANPTLKNCFDQTPGTRARSYSRNIKLADRLDNSEKAYLLRRQGQFRHDYRNTFTIDAEYAPNQPPMKLV